MADYKYVGDEGPDGILVGDGASSKIGFYGAAPVIQQTAATVFAAGDSTNTMGAAINALNTAIKNLGLAA
jgi:hypothetical protein